MTDDITAHWDDRYRGRTPSAELTPNPAFLQVLEDRPPGRLLELGCGHADASVLAATRGWHAHAVDLSEVALGRVRDRARERGVADRVTTERLDLAERLPQAAAPFDLVAGLFFQSEFALPRIDILRRAAALIVPGGLLLDVTHGAPPPWAPAHVHEHRFPSAREVWEELALDPGRWTAVRVEQQLRPATSPDGEAAELEDSVVLARRAG